MLNQLRRFHGSIANRVLYAFLALAFIGWGVGTFGDESVDVVAEVQGTRITRRDLDRETQMLQRRYEQMLRGVTLPRMPDLRSQALDNLIDSALIQHEVTTLGIDVTDDQLVTAITQMPELQENGRFNRDLLRRILESQRDRGEFEESLRRDLRGQRLQNLVTDGIQVTNAEVEDRYKVEREQVNLTFARVSAADLAKTAAVTDQDLEAQLTAHPELYRTPATVRARYVAYRRGEFEALGKPTPEQVQKFYDENVQERFTDPEQVHARQIILRFPPTDDKAKQKAKTEAEGLVKQLREGADFATLAQKHSKDPATAAKGGDLGFVARDRVPPPVNDALFKLKPGEVSDPVESPFGWYILKVEAQKPAGPRALDEVREQIEKELTAARSLELARQQADSDRRNIVRGKTLQEAVGERKVEETPAFAAGADIPQIGRVKAFSDEAFNLDENQVSNLIETDDAIYMLTPFERKEPVVPPLAEIRDKVEVDAKRVAGEKLAKEQAEKVLARAKEIGLDKAAAEASVALDETGDFDRRAGAVPKLGPANDVKADAFTLTPESPLGPRVYVASGDGVVVALKSRTPADLKDLETAQTAIRDSLLAERRQMALSSFMSYLKERAAREGALRVQADVTDRG